MPVADCPKREQLSAYVLGTLPEDDAEQLVCHVENCLACETVVQNLEGTADSLLARVRQPAPDDPWVQEPECREALAQAGQVGLEHPAPEVASGDMSDLAILGQYQLLEKLGQGGMGTVFKARHEKLGRVVALKVLPKSRMADAQAVARFEREMKAVGRLDHPNIVRAADADQVDDTPFLVMEYIEGLDLAELVRRCGPLPIADACELIRQAAVGLQAAHEHGLVHRDVKPSNLMLTADGTVKVLDLGLARWQAEEAADEELTGTNQVIGTADYMSPEQASQSHTVDIRADVYSLGCTLYKLLSGRAPFSGPGYDTPLKKVTGHARDAIRPIRRLRGEVPEELAGVMDRMLAKDPAARFATPEEVIEAITPFAAGCDLPGLLREAAQSGGPRAKAKKRPAATGALHDSARGGTHPPRRSEPRSTRRSAHRWLRRVSVAAGVLLLVVGTGLAYQIILRIKDKDGAERVISLPEGADVTIQPSEQARQPGAGESATPAPALLATLRHTDNVVFVAFSPDGKMLATASRDRTVKLWDTRTLARLVVFEGHPAEVTRLAFSADSRLLATGTSNGIISLWDRRGREPIARLKAHPRAFRGGLVTHAISLLFLPEGQTLVSGGEDGTVKLWDVQTHQLRATLKGHSRQVQDIALTRDGNLLASASCDRTVKLWDMSTGDLRATLVGHPAEVRKVAFSPDGMTLASSCDGGTCILWDAKTGRRRATLEGHRDRVPWLAFSPDGKTLASASFDKTIKLWDVETGRERATLKGHIHWVHHVAFSPDGKILASGGGEWPPGDNPHGEVRLWDPRTGRELAFLAGHTEQVWCVAFSPDGTKLVSSASDDVARVWDLRGLEVETPPSAEAKPAQSRP